MGDLPSCLHPATQLVTDDIVELTTDITREVSNTVLPVTYELLPEVLQKGDVVFVGQYLFTGSETSSVYLDVVETRPGSVFCKVRNSASLSGASGRRRLQLCSARSRRRAHHHASPFACHLRRSMCA